MTITVATTSARAALAEYIEEVEQEREEIREQAALLVWECSSLLDERGYIEGLPIKVWENMHGLN